MNFNFNTPKIYFGANCIVDNKEQLILGKKALIVTGKNSSKINGSLNTVTDVLNEFNIEYILFDEIEENPHFETIEKGRNVGLENKVDFIICIGGGSPLDGGKAISLFIKNEFINKENLSEYKNLDFLPIVCIPTTSGTGSEVTQYSIITDVSKQTKVNLGHTIYPTVSFLDYQFTNNLPLNITINTAIDTFCHLTEGFLNTNSNAYSDMLAKEGLEKFKECLPNLLDSNLNETFREKIMYASMIAGLLISQTGTSIPHGMSYHLTYFKNVPHGLACGIVLCEYLKTFENYEKMNSFLNILDMKDLNELEEVLNVLLDTNVTLTNDEINQYSSSLFDNKGKLKNHPVSISLDEIKNIYKQSLK